MRKNYFSPVGLVACLRVIVLVITLLWFASCKKEVATVPPGAQKEALKAFPIGGNVWYSLAVPNRPTNYYPQSNQTFTAGNILYVATQAENALWQYDPSTTQWTEKFANFFNFAIDERDTKCVFTNGNNAWFLTFSTKTLREVNLSTGVWTLMASYPGAATYPFPSTYTDTKGYIMGGTVENWEYNFATNSWVSKAALGGLGRSQGACFAIGDKIYFGAGYATLIGFNFITERPYIYSAAVADWYEYNITTNVWTPMASFGGGTRTEPGGFVIGGKVYMGLGFDGTQGLEQSDLWSYDPGSNRWGQVASEPYGGFAPLASGLVGYASVSGQGYIVPLDIRWLYRYTAPYSLLAPVLGFGAVIGANP